MPRSTLKAAVTATTEGEFIWEQERSILEVTELICEIMQHEGVSRKELAARLKKSPSFVTQLLDGSANMTLRTVADIFTALKYSFHPECSRLDGRMAPDFSHRVETQHRFHAVLASLVTEAGQSQAASTSGDRVISMNPMTSVRFEQVS